MVKTQKELAYLRDLYVSDEWTKRFTELIDKNVDLKDIENLLYINAGTGDHCFKLREKLNESTAIFATCEDEHILAIARDKALAVNSDVDFSMIEFEDSAFDAVFADASFVKPEQIIDFVEKAVRVARSGGRFAFVLPAAGSFGEVFSLIWEVLFSEDLGEHGAAAEKMISEIPSVSAIEDIAKNAGMVNIRTTSAKEVFEYANGSVFTSSSLVRNFLLPEWLKSLSEDEKEQVIEKLAQLIDTEDGTMTFRFSVKTTLLTGEKA